MEKYMSQPNKLDSLYDEAKQLIFITNDPTISMLQRHLKISYQRALDLMAALEGVVVTALDESGQRKMLYSDKAVEGVCSSWMNEIDWPSDENDAGEKDGRIRFRCFSQCGFDKELNDQAMLMPGIVQLGRTRSKGTVDLSKPQFFAIAGGLSTHPEAAIASAHLISWLQCLIRIEESDISINDLLRKVQRGFATEADNPKYCGMASTLVAAKLIGNDVTIFNVGNGRAYLLTEVENSFRAQRLSLDNGLSSQFIADPAYNGLQVNVVTHTLQQGERLLLCSDGVNAVLNDAQVAALFAENSDEALLKAYMASRRAGGVDDFSVIVIEVIDKPHLNT
jgi:PPM family protein phosphatase